MKSIIIGFVAVLIGTPLVWMMGVYLYDHPLLSIPIWIAGYFFLYRKEPQWKIGKQHPLMRGPKNKIYDTK